MTRNLHPLTQVPERPPQPQPIQGYTQWTAERDAYAITGGVSYYQSGDYISASVGLKITFYKGDEKQCTIDLPSADVSKALIFLKEEARGRHWETLDEIENDYHALRELAAAWFLEKFGYTLP